MEALEMYRRKDAEKALNVSRITLLRWIKDGTLPAVRIGRDWRIRADVIADIQQNGLELRGSEDHC